MLFELKKFIGFWLMPLPFCLALIAIGLVLMLLARRARLARALLITGAVLLMLLSNKLISRWLIRPLETHYPAIPEMLAGRTPPPDLAACRYVVVMGGGNGYGGGVSANNLLSTSAISRVAEAVRILRVLPEAKMIVSGPATGKRESHATVLARAAQSLGIDADRVMYIDNARDTEDESHAVAQLAGGAPVALVTSAWHMPRSIALFRNAGVKAVACPADYRSHADDPFGIDDLFWDVHALERSTFAVRERIGFLWIWLRGKT
jgi:uncharacterized SAM-binding protein YcdF (DUF218 family)